MSEIIVCLKIIIDPEAPLSIFSIDRDHKKPVPPVGMPPVFSPFDLNALEAALKLKDRHGSRVTVLSMGKSLPRALLQKTLAMGADEVIAVEDGRLEHLDPFSTARTLTAAIRKIGAFDLIFTGRQSADWDGGLVWAGIAEELQIPALTLASGADIQDRRVVVERCVSDGIETFEADMPALVTFSSEAGEPRIVSLQAMMKANKKPIQKWKAVDVGFAPVDIMSWNDLYRPELPCVDCRFIPDGSDEEKGRQLARILLDKGVVPTSSRGE